MKNYRAPITRYKNKGATGWDMEGAESIIGKKVVDIGILEDSDIEGGLAIDYEDEGEIKRYILGFTELGCWTEFNGTIEKATKLDKLRKKIVEFEKRFDFNLFVEDIDLVERPKEGIFIFVDKRSNEEILILSGNEIKILPKEVKEEFNAANKNVERIISKMVDSLLF